MQGFGDAGMVLAAIAGLIVGLLAFGVLLLALVPVLKRGAQASIAKGLLAVLVSFVCLSAGVFVAYLLSPGLILVFLIGELASFLLGWVVLAIMMIVGA